MRTGARQAIRLTPDAPVSSELDVFQRRRFRLRGCLLATGRQEGFQVLLVDDDLSALALGSEAVVGQPPRAQGGNERTGHAGHLRRLFHAEQFHPPPPDPSAEPARGSPSRKALAGTRPRSSVLTFRRQPLDLTNFPWYHCKCVHATRILQNCAIDERR